MPSIWQCPIFFLFWPRTLMKWQCCISLFESSSRCSDCHWKKCGEPKYLCLSSDNYGTVNRAVCTATVGRSHAGMDHLLNGQHGNMLSVPVCPALAGLGLTGCQAVLGLPCGLCAGAEMPWVCSQRAGGTGGKAASWEKDRENSAMWICIDVYWGRVEMVLNFPLLLHRVVFNICL